MPTYTKITTVLDKPVFATEDGFSVSTRDIPTHPITFLGFLPKNLRRVVRKAARKAGFIRLANTVSSLPVYMCKMRVRNGNCKCNSPLDCLHLSREV